jgi:hypothetical protein
MTQLRIFEEYEEFGRITFRELFLLDLKQSSDNELEELVHTLKDAS